MSDEHEQPALNWAGQHRPRILFDETDFATMPATSPILNRHFVLHGRSTGYGRRENAVKVLFALDQLASTVRRARRRPATPWPETISAPSR